MIKAPLKWVGGKGRIIDKIKAHLLPGKRLIEPFVGSGALFLNTDYDNYLLTDINPDLILFYQAIRDNTNNFIQAASELFSHCNDEKSYYALRDEFNACASYFRRALLFLYLNRHGFNGMCRYNRHGGYNVPYGKYRSVYFPDNEIRFFADKAKRATLACQDFSATIDHALPGDIIYCDPPYSPISSTADFTAYYSQSFSQSDHQRLICALVRAQSRGCHIVVSNSTPNDYINHFTITEIIAPRSISCKGSTRQPAREIIAIGRAYE